MIDSIDISSLEDEVYNLASIGIEGAELIKSPNAPNYVLTVDLVFPFNGIEDFEIIETGARLVNEDNEIFMFTPSQFELIKDLI